MTVSEPITKRENINKIKSLYKEKGQRRELLLFSLAINTGMMLNDLLNLKVSDVKNKDFLPLDKNKSVPINAELKKELSEFVEGRNVDEYLFVTNRGGKLDRSSVFMTFKNICQQTGLGNDINIASWRKTFGYHHYMKHHDLAYLQWLFNQQSADLTLEFIGIKEDMNRRCKDGVAL